MSDDATDEAMEFLLRDLGRVVVVGAELERALVFAVAWLAAGTADDLKIAFALTAGLNATQLADKVVQLLRVRGVDEALTKRVSDATGAAKTAWDARNRLVHSAWEQVGTGEEAVFRRQRIHRDRKFGYEIDWSHVSGEEAAAVVDQLHTAWIGFVDLFPAIAQAGAFGVDVQQLTGSATDRRDEPQI